MNKTVLNNLLENYDRDDFINLIYNLIKDNKETEKILLDFCKKHSMSSKQNIIIEKKIRLHWDEAYDIIEEDTLYGGCHYDDEFAVYDEIEEIEKLLKNNKVSWDLRKSILDSALEKIHIDNSTFIDMLLDFCENLCQTKEEELYMADSLSNHSSSYYRNYCANIYLKNGIDDKYLEIKKQCLSYGSDYIELANYYESKGNYSLALKTVEQSLNKIDGRLDEVYEYLFNKYKNDNNEEQIKKLYKKALNNKKSLETITELMYHYYKENKDYDNTKLMLMNLLNLKNVKNPKKWYYLCKENLTEKDFKKEEKNLLKLVKSHNLLEYLDISIEKGNYEEVLEALKTHPFSQYEWNYFDNEHKYSKQISDKYPKEIISLYWDETNIIISRGKEKNYIKALYVLKDIKQIMIKNNWHDEWEDIYKDFLEKHKKRTLLLKNLYIIEK